MNKDPSFNLWSEPWITVEQSPGTLNTLSIEQLLREAHNIHALYDPSPLVVVGIHRLLVAILQAAYRPQKTPDLVRIWQEKAFSAEKIADFGAKYADRFDIFSVQAPFMQTADLHPRPTKEDNAKPIGYLLEEQPAGTAVTHYNHTYDDHQILCSCCAAKGLLTMPAFASSGGAGIKPSINGVPPIYILPGGDTLFQALAGSLTTPSYQPNTPGAQDLPWWERPLPTLVEKKGEVRRVSYLHSLTFPARRIRLHPTPLASACSRCGHQTVWGVQTMVYEMGESRDQEASWWRDPFAAYRKPKNEKEEPLPVRPVEGRALWREYAAIFLPQQADEKGQKAVRPALLEQLEAVWGVNKTALPYTLFPLRTIGLRTDMKMKIFEWEEAGFAVPPRLFTDPQAADRIQIAIEFAKECDGMMKSTFNKHFSGGNKGERYTALKQGMSREYWQQMGQKFQGYIKQHTEAADTFALFHQWLDITIQTANQIFEDTTLNLPSDGHTLHERQAAIIQCRKLIFGYRKKNHSKPQEEPVL